MNLGRFELFCSAAGTAFADVRLPSVEFHGTGVVSRVRKLLAEGRDQRDSG